MGEATESQYAAITWIFLKSEVCFLRSKKNECNEKIRGRTETRRMRRRRRRRRTDRDALA